MNMLKILKWVGIGLAVLAAALVVAFLYSCSQSNQCFP